MGQTLDESVLSDFKEPSCSVFSLQFAKEASTHSIPSMKK